MIVECLNGAVDVDDAVASRCPLLVDCRDLDSPVSAPLLRGDVEALVRWLRGGEGDAARAALAAQFMGCAHVYERAMDVVVLEVHEAGRELVVPDVCPCCSFGPEDFHEEWSPDRERDEGIMDDAGVPPSLRDDVARRLPLAAVDELSDDGRRRTYDILAIWQQRHDDYESREYDSDD